MKISDIDLLEALAIAEARDSFWAYRQYINGDKFIKGWWQRKIAYALQRFYSNLIAGRRPKAVFEAPPQHGKLLADHTPVLTTCGWKTHGDLVVGDYVYHPSGNPVRVIATSSKDVADVRVDFSNGESIWCHENHEWTVFNRRKKKYETVETKEFLGQQLFTGEKGKRGCHYVYKLPKSLPVSGQGTSLPLDPCSLPRKITTPSENKKRVSIINVERDDKGHIGNCIQVDSPDGLYLVGDTLIPTHNSQMIVEFITWVAGQNPELRTIYTSFSERLGVRANLMCQRIYDSPKYQKLFPETRISRPGVQDTFGGTRNRELLEYINHAGYFRNTTVRGSITGEGLDLGVIDDPIKGRKEAGSPSVRDETWDWLTDDFFTRFADDAGLLSILTRWHVDDPIGRFRAKFGDEVEVISYPAIAVVDEEFRKVGEPLFPEHKSLEFLLERKSIMASHNWEALYQQNPQIVGGELIKGNWFGRYSQLPVIEYRLIFADTAQKTSERNDFSVFECWGLGADRNIYLLDLIRGKWEAPDLKRRAIDFWNKHKSQDSIELGALRKMWVEDKSSGTGLIQQLKSEGNIVIDGIERNKDKYTRVLDNLGYIESGRVKIPEAAPFVNDFIYECEAFSADDSHEHDDQVDPMLDAIEKFLGQNTTNIWERL